MLGGEGGDEGFLEVWMAVCTAAPLPCHDALAFVFLLEWLSNLDISKPGPAMSIGPRMRSILQDTLPYTYASTTTTPTTPSSLFMYVGRMLHSNSYIRHHMIRCQTRASVNRAVR